MTIREFIRLKEVKHRVSMSSSSIYRKVKDRTFPVPYQLTGSRSVAWDAAEIQEWIESRPRVEWASTQDKEV